MSSQAASEPRWALSVFQVLTIAAPVLFYITASITSTFFATRTSKGGKGISHKAQLLLALLTPILSSAEAAVDLGRSDSAKVTDPDAVYSLFLTLVFTILFLGLLDNTSGPSYSHCGAWVILVVCQGTVFALCTAAISLKDQLLLLRAILQGSQLAIVVLLLVNSVLTHYYINKNDAATDDETRPLLAGETPAIEAREDNAAKELDEDEIDRLRIRNRPFRKYLASFKVFVPYMYPQSRMLQLYFLGMCVLSAATRLATIALPLSLGALINGLGVSIPWNALSTYAILKFLTSAAGLSLVQTWLADRVRIDQTIALERHCYSHIMNLSAEFHDSKKSSIIWQVSEQGQDVVDLLHDTLFEIIPQLIDMVLAVMVLTYLFGLYMTFISLSTGVLFYYLTLKSLVTKRALRRSWNDSYHEQYYQMTESTSNWASVAYFGRIPYEIQHFRNKSDVTRTNMLEWWVWEFWNRGLRHILPFLTFVAASIVAAVQITHHRLKLGDFVVLISYWEQLTGPLSSIAGELSQLTEHLVNAKKLVALLEKKPQVQDQPDACPFNYREGAVEFENVTFSYDGNRQVAKGITFRAAPGQTIALVGQSGGGKSTILRLLFRFYDVDQGRILLDGQDIRHVKMDSFRKHIAMVPQNPVVFNMSIMANVKYPDTDCTDEEAIAACRAVALHDKIMTFTKGYQEKVGERGAKLSGGELQRLAIARAILKKADILLLDEATSSVDGITERKIQESIRQLCAGKTAFVIAHRLSTILHADHILVLRDGELTEAGTHHELLQQDGAYSELWRSQLNLQSENTTSSTLRLSRTPEKSDAQVLVNDLSTSGEDTQSLIKTLSRSGLARTNQQNVDAVISTSSSICENDHPSHSTAHDSTKAQDKLTSNRMVRALGRRISRSRSPKKLKESPDSSLNPGAKTFKLSRSQSPHKAEPPESMLNPHVRTFRPRRFQDGNDSSSFSEEMPVCTKALSKTQKVSDQNQFHPDGVAAKENGTISDIAKIVFPLNRRLDKRDMKMDGRDSTGTDDSIEAGQIRAGDILESAPPNVTEPSQIVKSMSGNIRRRQAASAPCQEATIDDGDSEKSSEDDSTNPLLMHSRLPQIGRGRAVSAIARKTVTVQHERERSLDDNEPRAPITTAATSPGIRAPNDGVDCRGTAAVTEGW